MYISSTPVSTAAAAANATRATIMCKAHVLARTMRENRWGEYFTKPYAVAFAEALHRVWGTAKKEAAEVALVAARKAAGKTCFLEKVPFAKTDRCALKRVVSFNPATNKKEFVVVPHQLERYAGDTWHYKLVAVMPAGVYGVADEDNYFQYVQVDANGKLNWCSFASVAHLVPARAAATPYAKRGNDYRDEAYGDRYYQTAPRAPRNDDMYREV